MTELERMQQAKDYLLQLANGINPLTGQEVPASDLINQVQISRCLFYASDVLRQVIESGGLSKGKQKKLPFDLPPEMRGKFVYSDRPVTISQIAQGLNDLVDLEQMQRLKVTSLTKFLMQSGLLYEHEKPDGKKQKLPTETGVALGLSVEDRDSQNGPYAVVTYSRAAQQLLLDNLDSIIAINAEPRHDNQGKPWTAEQDHQLQQMASEGADIKQLSETFKRSRGAIRGRLEKLGIVLDPSFHNTEDNENLPF